MKKGIIGIWILGILLTSCGHSSGSGNKAGTSDSYPTLTVSKQTATLERTYPVTLKGEQDIEIKPRVDGFIESIFIDEGSTVKAGQALFKINSPASVEALAIAEAVLASAKAKVNTARIDVDRYRPLAEKEIVSPLQLKAYENAYETAVAAQKQAEATLANAKAGIAWATVTSPIDGVVGTIPFRQGSLVNSGSVLTTVSSINNVYAYFSMNEKELMELLNNTDGNSENEKIKNLPELKLVLADNSIYRHEGKIETISGIVDTQTGSVNIRAFFPNKELLLKSGSMGKIIIPRKVDNVYIIPQKATFSQQDKTVVYKVRNDSVFQILISVISLPDGQNYAVTGGLQEGDQIVTDGIATLSQGKKITYESAH